MRRKMVISFVLVGILAIGSVIFINMKKDNEKSIERNSIEHSSSDFGSDGWHKYRIRNKKTD